jgi:hypothetical protein
MLLFLVLEYRHRFDAMPVSRIKAWPDFFGHGPFSIIYKALWAASFIPRGRGVQFFLKIFKNVLQEHHSLAQKVKIFIKNGILGGAFSQKILSGVCNTYSPP